MPLIPTLGEQTQEDQVFKVTLSFIGKSGLHETLSPKTQEGRRKNRAGEGEEEEEEEEAVLPVVLVIISNGTFIAAGQQW